MTTTAGSSRRPVEEVLDADNGALAILKHVDDDLERLLRAIPNDKRSAWEPDDIRRAVEIQGQVRLLRTIDVDEERARRIDRELWHQAARAER